MAVETTDDAHVHQFGEEDLEATVQTILQNPSRFQLAVEDGSLHTELCIATHYGDIVRNRNIVSIDQKDTGMRIYNGGSDIVTINKYAGIRQIVNNNSAIVRRKRVVEILSPNDILKTSRKTYKDLELIIRNKGARWSAPTSILKKQPPPKSYLYNVLEDDLLESVVNALLRFVDGEFSDYDDVVCYMSKAFQRTTIYHNGLWWKSINDQGGWLLLLEASQVYQDVSRCVKEMMSDVSDHICRHTMDELRLYIPDFVDKTHAGVQMRRLIDEKV